MVSVDEPSPFFPYFFFAPGGYMVDVYRCASQPTRRWPLKYLWQQQKAIKSQCQYASEALNLAGHLVANLIHSGAEIPLAASIYLH